MSINQSYRHVFVANSSVLLASGTTVDLAPGQVAIVDGNNYKPTVSPTYATNKGIVLYLGMPTHNLPSMAGLPKTNQASKLIKGKLLTKFRRKTAVLGQNQIVAIGFDGIDITKNLHLKCGERRQVFIRLTGNPIDKVYNSTPGQGILRQYWIESEACDDCTGDACADVNADYLADQLVAKINGDSKLKFNNDPNGAIIRAKKVRSSALSTSGAVSYTEYTLAIADNGDIAALAFVQAQYPGISITRIERTGIFSTYKLTKITSGGAPASFTNAGIYVLPICAACPAGYTLNASGYLYKVVRADAGDGTALTTMNTNYAIAAAGESTVRISYDTVNAVSTYLVTSNTANQAASGTDQITSYGSVIGRCVLTTPVTTAWTALSPVKYAFPKVYHITLKDNECGVNRLAELQAAYPLLTVTQEADGAVACIHQYTTTIYSDPAGLECSSDQIIFTNKLAAYQGTSWVEAAAGSPFTGQAGVIIETAFIRRITNEVLYDYYPYESDTVHIQISEGDEDYNGVPEFKYNRWPVTELQNVKYPQGVGAYVREQEIKSLGYFLRERSQDPAVRDAEGYRIFTDENALYDEYTLHFDFSYKVLGWSQTYTDSYQHVVYFKTGAGKAFENAILTYISSIGNDVDVELR